MLRIAVNWLSEEYLPIRVRASVQNNGGEEVVTDSILLQTTGIEFLELQLTSSLSPGDYLLLISGETFPSHSNSLLSADSLGEEIFHNVTRLKFDAQQVIMLIQTSKPFYTQFQTRESTYLLNLS